MKRNLFRKIVNYLSGSALCVAGVLLIVKGQTVEGVAMVTAGITKITAQELQENEIVKVKKVIAELPVKLPATNDFRGTSA